MEVLNFSEDIKVLKGDQGAAALITRLDSLTDAYCSSDCNACGSRDVQVHRSSSASNSKKKKGSKTVTKKLVNWGAKNCTPSQREALIEDNNIVATLMTTKRNYTIGTGVLLYRESWENGKCITEVIQTPEPIHDFLCKVHINKYMIRACADLIKHSNIFTEFILDRGGQVTSFKSIPAKYMRAAEKDNAGHIPCYFHSTSYATKSNANKHTRAQKVTEIANYQESKVKQANKFIYHTGDPLLHDGYYFIPAWWGGKKWLMLSNCIPEFHLANLKHGYTLRYHIEIPRDYFLDYSEFITGPGWSPSSLKQKELKKCLDNAQSAESAFMLKLNKFLSGVQNAGRAIVTKSRWDKTLGKEYPGIKITPLKAELYDDKLLKLFEKSNQANISAQGLHPTLANVETQGKLSSGSEIRNALAAYLATQFVNRNILMEALQIVRKINKWDDLEGMDKNVKFGFKELQILRLDEDKSGKAIQSAEA